MLKGLLGRYQTHSARPSGVRGSTRRWTEQAPLAGRVDRGTMGSLRTADRGPKWDTKSIFEILSPVLRPRQPNRYLSASARQTNFFTTVKLRYPILPRRSHHEFRLSSVRQQTPYPRFQAHTAILYVPVPFCPAHPYARPVDNPVWDDSIDKWSIVIVSSCSLNISSIRAPTRINCVQSGGLVRRFPRPPSRPSEELRETGAVAGKRSMERRRTDPFISVTNDTIYPRLCQESYVRQRAPGVLRRDYCAAAYEWPGRPRAKKTAERANSEQ